MRAIVAPDEILNVTTELRAKGRSIGLVPTMGALHKGHFALVSRSLKENDVTIVSIFVNPLQFNNANDLANYPRSIEEDSAQLKSLGADFLFEPTNEHLYAPEPVVSISFGDLERRFEGEFRPGHFSGVGVVVSKLFNLIQPTSAYFGLKDLQQFMIIRKMVEDFSMPTKIVGVETVREESGLAMSSRNRRLSVKGLEIASNIYKGLARAKKDLLDKKDLMQVKTDLQSSYDSIEGLNVEYLEIINPIDFTLKEEYNEGEELAICFAGYVDGVRLIDNLYLRPI